jgi:hypothetical protein
MAPPTHDNKIIKMLTPISITKTLLIVPTKNERDPPLFTGKLLIKFQNILRNTIQVIIRHIICIDTAPIYSEHKPCPKVKTDFTVMYGISAVHVYP